MERNLERELYYEINNIRTKVNKHGFSGQDNVHYNHVHDNILAGK